MAKIETFENERATHYDTFIQVWVPNYASLLRMVAKGLTAEHKGTPASVLVAGCGTGNDIQTLMESSKNLRITGVDPSPEMVAIARKKLADCADVTVIEGTVDSLDLNDPFDAATLVLVLHFMPDDGTKLALLQDIAERLQPGGTFFLVDIFGTERELATNLKMLGAYLPEEIPEAEKDNRLRRIAEKLHPVSESRLTHLLTSAGFEPPVRFFQGTIYGGWKTSKSKAKS